MIRRTSRLIAAATAAASLALLGGCGIPEKVVGLRAAPAEHDAAAALDPEGALTIATRVLGEADKARAASGAAGKQARTRIMSSGALVLADATAAMGEASPVPVALSATPPVIVAVSAGRGWPRAILASTLDEATNVASLHLLVSSAPAEPFVLAASTPMFGGATLPALAAEGKGAPWVSTAESAGRVLSPDAAVAAYAAALAYPKRTVSAKVAISDTFAAGLLASASAQSKALGKLATLTQAQRVVPKTTFAMELADGGAVVFTLLARRDTVKLAATAKEVTLPVAYQKVTKKKKATKIVVLDSYEAVVLVVPAAGKVSAIGATEQLYAGSAT